jgi:DNA-binding NarL/FixJ family response regulator
MKPVTVLLAEDHLILREGLRALLKMETDIEIVGEADDGRQAVMLVRKLRSDVVVMDIAMPLLNGLEATRQILADAPATKVLILSAHSDDAYVEHIMALGASGYLIKQSAARDLAGAIRKVHKGILCFSPAISKCLRQRQAKSFAGNNETRPLTSREREVLQRVAEGKTNKETASELKISIKTVEKHRQSLMEKLNIHDTAGLNRHAIAAGIIESSVQVTIIE